MDAVEDLKNHIKNERERGHEIRNYFLQHPELNVRQTEIIEHLMSNPKDVLTIKAHQMLNKLAYQTARTDLLDLEEKKWLKSIKKGKKFYFVPADNFWKEFENEKT